MSKNYTYPLGITSQFSFCGLPLRLDTYSGCAFNCTYCYARLRGGKLTEKRLRSANPDLIIKKVKSSFERPEITTGIVSESIRRKMPIHFGGMSDPFQPIEKSLKVSLKVLKYLCEINYPLVISTRSTLVSNEEYLSVLKQNPNVLIQFSFSSLDDRISRITEPFANCPSDIMNTIYKVSLNQINTSLRWQPFIPRVSENIEEFVSKASNLGVKHLGFEHLKLPVERKSLLWKRLTSSLAFDIHEHYKESQAKIDGREYVLPAEYKLENIMLAKKETNERNMTFGSADNEFQYLSDNYCCCSGVDQFKGFENWNKFQIAHAIKKSNFGDITFDLIDEEWKPQGAIDQYLNSRSRLTRNGDHNKVYQYVVQRWEDLKSDFNPERFYGVTYSGNRDENGFRIYHWDELKMKKIKSMDLRC